MMTDQDLINLYQKNLGESHYAGLRGIWDDGFNVGAGVSVQTAQTTDPSLTVQAAAQAVDDPLNIQTV